MTKDLKIIKSTSGFVRFPPPQDDVAPKKPKGDKATAKPLGQPTKKRPAFQPKPMNNNLGFSRSGFSDFGLPPINRNDDKTEIIKKVFNEVLGKDPEPRDLSYYRFSPMEEEEIRQQLLSGKEHRELLEKGRKYDQIKEELETQKAKVKVLERHIKDQLEEFTQLHNLLKEKNRYIRELRQQSPKISSAEYSQIQEQPTREGIDEQAQPHAKNSLSFDEKASPPLEAPEPPMPHFTNGSQDKNVKKKNIWSNIFRS